MILEVNPSFSALMLNGFGKFTQSGTTNAQREYLLTDLAELATQEKPRLHRHPRIPMKHLGLTRRKSLHAAPCGGGEFARYHGLYCFSESVVSKHAQLGLVDSSSSIMRPCDSFYVPDHRYFRQRSVRGSAVFVSHRRSSFP